VAQTNSGGLGREVAALKRISTTRAPERAGVPSRDVGQVIFVPPAEPANDVAPPEALVSLARALGALAAELRWEGILTDPDIDPLAEKARK
jgi:hypothetical protein